jgi:mRNA-degrading endonuclease toxin of MazEF toxin-antitoxin module
MLYETQGRASDSSVAANESDHEFPRRGEIWLVETPNQPDDPHQPRPALVVSEDYRNSRSDDIVLIPIFSSRRLGPTRVAIRAGVGGLSHNSILYCEEIVTLHRSFVIDEPLGDVVSPSLMGRVVRAVRRALGEVVPELA